MKTLYLIRGIAGSGKSSFAEEMSVAMEIPYYEADMFLFVRDEITKEWVYDWKPEKLQQAHADCLYNVDLEMLNGWSVIVSNTFTRERELKPYLDLAEKYGYKVVSLVVEQRHNSSSVHDVPEETLVKQENRLKNAIVLRRKNEN